MIYDPKNYTYNGLIVAMEFWKPITEEMVPGIMPIYHISTLGNLYNSETNTYSNASVKENKYIHVLLRAKDGRRIPTTIHRLVCLAFNGPCPGPGYEVDHINCDKTCSYYENLEFVPKRENIRRAYENDLFESGDKRYNSKMSNDEIREICEMLSKGIPINEIISIMEQKIYPRKYADISSIIYQVLHGEAWRVISKDYIFANYSRIHLTDNMIHKVCKAMENNMKYDDIIDKVLCLNVDDHERERIKETFYNIKRGESFKHISSQYSIAPRSYTLTEDELNYVCKMIVSGMPTNDIIKSLGDRGQEKKIKCAIYDIARGTCHKKLLEKYKNDLNKGSTTSQMT